MRTASFAKEDRKPINRIKLIEVVKVPASRDDNVYRNNQQSPLRYKDQSLSKKNS